MSLFARLLALFAALSIALLIAITVDVDSSANVPQVRAVLETEPVLSPGDAADDVAIWIDPSNPLRSMIVATDKDRGLVTYDLSGNALQHLAMGEINNVDLRDGFSLGGERITLIAGSNRTDKTVVVLTIDPVTRLLRVLNSVPIRVSLEDAYGLCMYHSPKSDRFYIFVTSTGNGAVEQWEMFDDAGKVGARQVRSFIVGSDAEGCVADDQSATLYVSEEMRGIWRYGAEPSDGDARMLIDHIGGENPLKADLEGLAIYQGASGASYLVASNQGNSEFVVYDRANGYAYVGSFKIGGGATVDAVTLTDGIDLTHVSLGPTFPQGVLIVQDHRNTNPIANQNFKLVSWADVARALDLPDASATATQEPLSPAQAQAS